MSSNTDEQKALDFVNLLVSYLDNEIDTMKRGLKKRTKEVNDTRPVLKCILMYLERQHDKYQHIAINMDVQQKFTNVLGKRLAKDINVIMKPQKEEV